MSKYDGDTASRVRAQLGMELWEESCSTYVTIKRVMETPTVMVTMMPTTAVAMTSSKEVLLDFCCS